jgi:predicted metal-dependent phosphoesterase TrpH
MTIPWPKLSVDVALGALSARQQAAIAALVAGKALPAAAAAATVTVRTLHRWRQDPAFDAELGRARDAAFAETLATLRAASGEAVAACRTLLKATPGRTEETRLAAARAILALALKAHEAVGIEERLRALEARV